jgi:hypothetical protein
MRGKIRLQQKRAIFPRAWTADDFSSMKFTSTSIPTKSASSSESESNEKASFGLYSSSSFTPAFDLHVLRISVSTWSIIGAISLLRILANSAK